MAKGVHLDTTIGARIVPIRSGPARPARSVFVVLTRCTLAKGFDFLSLHKHEMLPCACMNPRSRTLLFAAVSFLVVWLIAWGGYTIARNSKMTAEKVRAYLSETDLRKLSGAKRAKALRDLAAKINSLTAEERRKFRGGLLVQVWFNEMSEQEKGEFLEATMPSGFKQMIGAFEQLPVDKRKKALDDAVKRMKEARETSDSPKGLGDPSKPPVLSEDLQKKVATIGLKSFYSQSSAQTKAEMAPLMEEIQRSMESGRMFR